MSRQRNLWRTLPGIAISLFCLWWTFRKVRFDQLRQIHVAGPWWVPAMLACITVGYLLRVHRWRRMLRGRAKFSVCGRVLMTSFAANNIMPFRIGDFMRVFTYSGDLGVGSSEILSTVVLEKSLDIFALFFLLSLTMTRTTGFSLPRMPHLRMVVMGLLAVISAALLVMMLGARLLEMPLRRLIAAMPDVPFLQKRLGKIEHWLLMGLHTMAGIGIVGTMWLIAESVAIWTLEGTIFVSAARFMGIVTDFNAPWQALVLSNLFYMIPSMPGAIGTFETGAKFAMTSHHVANAPAALYALLVHVFSLLLTTLVGGVCFLVHRRHMAQRKPLLQEIETLPEELPEEEVPQAQALR